MAHDKDHTDELNQPDENGFAVYDPKYCLTCGQDLSDFDKPGACPYCERGFDPADPATYADTPLEGQANYWREKPRLAGYALILLFLLGRFMINTAAGDWSDWIASPAGGGVGAVVAALMALFVIPWAIACVWLLLIGTDEYYNPTLMICLILGLAAGVLLTLGLHPALTVIGGICGPFAGLLHHWRVT